MKNLTEWVVELVKENKIDLQKTIAIRQELWSSGTINMEKADFLVRLRNSVKELDPTFHTMFFEAIRDFILRDNEISENETKWLDQMFMTVKFDQDTKTFLADLNKSAKKKHSSFAKFYDNAIFSINSKA